MDLRIRITNPIKSNQIGNPNLGRIKEQWLRLCSVLFITILELEIAKSTKDHKKFYHAIEELL